MLSLMMNTDGYFGEQGSMPELNSHYKRDEVVRLLREVANEIEDGCDNSSIKEINGNECGSYSLSLD